MLRSIRHATAMLLVLAIVGCQSALPRGPGISSSVTPSGTGHSPVVPLESRAATLTPNRVASSPATISSPTNPPSATPSVTPSPTPSPTPTLGPDALLAKARQLSADGDYGTAIPLWESGVRSLPVAYRDEAALSLARAHLAEGQRDKAIAVLTALLGETAISDTLIQAWAMLAVAQEAGGAWRAAIAAYQRYLELDSSALPMVRWHMAKAYEALGENTRALEELASIPTRDLTPAQVAEILEELAAIQRRLRQYDEALTTYGQILEFAERPEYRALIRYKVGEALREAERQEEALAQFRAILQDQPRTYGAYLALAALDEAEAAEVDDLQRAEILFAAREYDATVAVLQRYLGASAEPSARAHYLLGLCYQRLDQDQQALASLERVSEDYPNDALAPEAWMVRAEIARGLGGDPSGLYHEFGRLYPQHARAPEALWLTALYHERARNWQEARDAYHRLVAAYPSDQRVAEARFREGLAAYALGEYAAAEEVWGPTLGGTLGAGERARYLMWMGLASARAQDLSRATEFWQQAVATDPEGFYGVRAADLLADKPLRAVSPVYALSEDPLLPADWAAIAAWLRAWPSAEGESASGTPTPGPTRTPTPSVAWSAANDPLALRAQALERFSWHQEAQLAYQSLREKAWHNPQALLELARLGYERGEHILSISCADRLMALGRKASAPPPPASLRRLAYPLYYGHLVRSEGEAQGVDPLLFLALIRQESRFDAQAISYAGARGLTQVMPDTGTWIATRLDLADYRTELLYRPLVSVRFGTWFLGWLLQENDRDWIAALVAYNAGPGNLQRMTGGQPIGDFDLFYETIPIAQTKAYVDHIYQQYRTYQEIYR